MNFTAWPVCNGFAWTPAYISRRCKNNIYGINSL